MFIERFRSDGLAHLSYFVGGREKAAVVDARRDCEIYRQIARREGLRITHIFETHRNEDYVVGSRELSTLGYERRYNLVLTMTERQEFVDYKGSEHHYVPPYFKRMEQQNLKGPDLLNGLPDPCACSADEFASAIRQGMGVVDVRSPEGFGGAHIPDSLSIPLEMVPSFAGWFLPYDTPLGLVVEHPHDVDTAVRYLVRIGYDHVRAYLAEGMHDWETGGRHFGGIPQVYIGEIKRRLDAGEDFTLLDVRSEQEFKAGHLRGAQHIYVGELPGRLSEIPRSRPVVTFCGSGHRAIIAASVLKRNGLEQVENCLGSMAACRATGWPLETAA